MSLESLADAYIIVISSGTISVFVRCHLYLILSVKVILHLEVSI